MTPQERYLDELMATKNLINKVITVLRLVRQEWLLRVSYGF